MAGEPPLSAGRGWAKDVVFWPQADPSVPAPSGSDTLKLWRLPPSLGHFVSEASLVPPWRTIVEMSSTLNASLPRPILPGPSPPTGPSPHPHGLGAKITLESLLLVDSFSLYKYIIYIIYYF